MLSCASPEGASFRSAAYPRIGTSSCPTDVDDEIGGTHAVGRMSCAYGMTNRPIVLPPGNDREEIAVVNKSMHAHHVRGRNWDLSSNHSEQSSQY